MRWGIKSYVRARFYLNCIPIDNNMYEDFALILYLETSPYSPYRIHFPLQGPVHLAIAVTFMTYRD